jgi:hypothetical protein
MVTAGLGAFALIPALAKAAPACGMPDWALTQRPRLEQMAAELTRRLKPWSGPKHVATPEQFGHKSGDALSTKAIQAAVDAVAAKGGGTVRLAAGDYVSGTVELRDNTRLEIARDARLLGSFDLADWPERVAKRRTVQDTNMGMNQSLIHAEGATNISVCGEGVIDGRGDHFHGPETAHATPGRPFILRIIDCKRVHIKDITLRDSPCWMQNYLNCEDLLIEGIHVDNQANFNNDGCDIDGCRGVIVRNVFINSEDDGLCFKGASQRPMEDVLVENCHLYSTCNALKFGTDSQGDFRRVLVRNVEVGGPAIEMRARNRRMALSGVAFESVDGNTVEDILVSDVHIVRSSSPLFLRLGDRGRVQPDEPRPAPGHIRRIVYDRLTGADNGSRGALFSGLPGHPIEDIVLRAVDVPVSATRLAIPDEATIPEKPGDYPDPQMFGEAVPAYGLWARHLRTLTLIDVKFPVESGDPRPMFKTSFDAAEVCGA